MKNYVLLRSQKNDTLDSIEHTELNPLDFTWTEEETEYVDQYGDYDYLVSVLRHTPGNFYFKFDRDTDGWFVCRFAPGKIQFQEDAESTNDWSDVLTNFTKWLSHLEREVAPDLWEQIKEYTPDETFVATDEISNAPFSYSEAEKVIESLDRLQLEIEENFKLQGDQLAFVSRQIDYLKDAAKRQGRKDWIHTSIGVIVTIATGLALSPEKAKLLWDLVRSCFASVLPLPAP